MNCNLGCVRWRHGLLEPNSPFVESLALTVSRLSWPSRAGGRRELDATRIVHRLAPRSLLRSVLRLAPYAAAPLIVALFLGYQVANGFQSKRARMRDRDYWKQNLATWKDAPKPAVLHADLAVSFEPRQHSFHTAGTYTLLNAEKVALRQIALTLGGHVPSCLWTLDGARFEPENRTGLFVFGLRVRWRRATRSESVSTCGPLRCVTRNARMGSHEPSGVVLTSFSPTSFRSLLPRRLGSSPRRTSSRGLSRRLVQGRGPSTLAAPPFDDSNRARRPSEPPTTRSAAASKTRSEPPPPHSLGSDQPVYFFNVVPVNGPIIVARDRFTPSGAPLQHREMTWLWMARAGISPSVLSDLGRLKVLQFANLRATRKASDQHHVPDASVPDLPMAPGSRHGDGARGRHQWWGTLLMPAMHPGRSPFRACALLDPAVAEHMNCLRRI